MSESKTRRRTKVVAKPQPNVAIKNEKSDELDEGSKSKRSKAEDAYRQSMGAQRKHRVWARVALISGVLVVGYFMRKDEKAFALFKDHHPLRIMKLDCALKDDQFEFCSPVECGRIVSDNIVPLNDANSIKEFALKFFKGKKVKGPVNVFPLSNSTSFMQSFKRSSDPVSVKALMVFRLMVLNLMYLIEERFGVRKEHIYLTHPVFISQITNNSAITIHDEYYQEHIDADTYPAFHYTALLYLSDFSADFTGGRFMFNDQNKTKYSVEPKVGRTLIFTSGSENTHSIEKVKSGTRYAMTIPFTCDQSFALQHGSVADIGL